MCLKAQWNGDNEQTQNIIAMTADAYGQPTERTEDTINAQSSTQMFTQFTVSVTQRPAVFSF